MSVIKYRKLFNVLIHLLSIPFFFCIFNATGNWVLNDPKPNKALELAKCQRYYEVSSGRYTLASNGTYMVKLVPKRVIPTITLPYVNPDGKIGADYISTECFRASTNHSGRADFTWIADSDL